MKNLSFEEYQKQLSTVDLNDKTCPVHKLLTIFSGKWHLRVVLELTKADSMRFGVLKKQIAGITNTMLSSTLKSLEEDGLLNRKQFNEIPPHVEYSLSEKGKELYPIFIEMLGWVQKYGTHF